MRKIVALNRVERRCLDRMEIVENETPKVMTWKQVKYLGLLFDKTKLNDDEKDRYWSKVVDNGFTRQSASAVIDELIGERNGFLKPEDY